MFKKWISTAAVLALLLSAAGCPASALTAPQPLLAVTDIQVSADGEEYSSSLKLKNLRDRIYYRFLNTHCVIDDEIRQGLRQLYLMDPELGTRWADFLEYWEYLNSDMPELYDVCSDGLPEEGLCIVVLGYQLSGSRMQKPLIDRCQVALNCAEKYPDIPIILTGGRTGGGLYSESEAMGQWLVEQGVSEDRIYLEKSAGATTYNAINTRKLIEETGLPVKNLILITSDFHIRSSAAVFACEFILSGSPIRIIETVGSATARGYCKDYEAQTNRVAAVKVRHDG